MPACFIIGQEEILKILKLIEILDLTEFEYLYENSVLNQKYFLNNY